MTHNFNLTDLEKESIFQIICAIEVNIYEGSEDFGLIEQFLKHIYQDKNQRIAIFNFFYHRYFDSNFKDDIEKLGWNAEEFFAINGHLEIIQKLLTKSI